MAKPKAKGMVPIYLSRVIWSDRFVATQYLSTALRERRQPSVYRIAWGWFLNGFFFYCLLWSLIRDGCELSHTDPDSKKSLAVPKPFYAV